MRVLELAGLTVRVTGGEDGEGSGDGGLVVLLHGFGAPGTDLVPLGRPTLVPPGTRFAFPAAPLTLGGPGGMPGYAEARAWWEIDVEALERALATGQERDHRGQVPEGMAEATAQVSEMLTALESEIGVAPEKTVIGGFSQGSMLACDLVFGGERSFAGLMVLSGTLLAEELWRPRMASRADLRVFQSHGRQDPLLPFNNAVALRDAMLGAGLRVDWIEFDGGHALPDSLFRQGKKFLHEVLK